MHNSKIVKAVLFALGIALALATYQLAFNSPHTKRLPPTEIAEPKNKPAQSSTETTEEYKIITGEIVSVDTSAMEYDGDGIYRIDSAGKIYTVLLTSGESVCAVYEDYPNNYSIDSAAKEGSKVEVRGKLGSSGDLRICESNTYIRTIE